MLELFVYPFFTGLKYGDGLVEIDLFKSGNWPC